MRTHSVRISTRDRVGLATDVHQPGSGPGDDALTFLLRTPYGRRGGFDAVPELAEYLTGLGHILVSQDVRGKFDSEGRCAPFAQELSDGRDTVEWIAAQSWSTGRVVPTGESYCGFTALMAAATRHPSIVAVMAGMTTTRVASDWLNCGGAFRLHLNAEWITMSFGHRRLPDLPWTLGDWWEVGDVDHIDTRDADLSALYELRSVPADSAGDTELSGGLPERGAHVAAVPVVLWTGYWDPLARGTVSEFQAAAAARPEQRHHLEIVSADHLGNRWDAALRHESEQADRATSLLRCYRRNMPHLMIALSESPAGRPGRRNAGRSAEASLAPGPEAEPFSRGGPTVAYEDQHGYKYDSTRWPPARPVITLARFDEEVEVPGPGPFPALPNSGESLVWGTLAASFPDERAAAERDDVVVLTFAARDLVGSLVLEADVEWNDGLRIIATLAQEQPDGRVLRVAEGVATRTAPDRSSWSTEPLRLDLGPACHRGVVLAHLSGSAERDNRDPTTRWWLLLAQEYYPRYLPSQQAHAWLTEPDLCLSRGGIQSRSRRAGSDRVVLRGLALRTADGAPSR